MGKRLDQMNQVSPMEDISQGVSTSETRRIPVVEMVRKYVPELSTDDALIRNYNWDKENHCLEVYVEVGEVTRTLTREGMIMAGRAEEKTDE